jgi:hypothetical protein
LLQIVFDRIGCCASNCRGNDRRIVVISVRENEGSLRECFSLCLYFFFLVSSHICEGRHHVSPEFLRYGIRLNFGAVVVVGNLDVLIELYVNVVDVVELFLCACRCCRLLGGGLWRNSWRSGGGSRRLRSGGLGR